MSFLAFVLPSKLECKVAVFTTIPPSHNKCWTSAGEVMERNEPSFTAGGMHNYKATTENSMAALQKINGTCLMIQQSLSCYMKSVRQ